MTLSMWGSGHTSNHDRAKSHIMSIHKYKVKDEVWKGPKAHQNPSGGGIQNEWRLSPSHSCDIWRTIFLGLSIRCNPNLGLG